MPVNPWEELGRSKKCAALVDILRTHQISAALAELMDYDDWVACAALAKVIPPSEETQKLVIAQLRAGEGR